MFQPPATYDMVLMNTREPLYLSGPRSLVFMHACIRTHSHTSASHFPSRRVNTCLHANTYIHTYAAARGTTLDHVVQPQCAPNTSLTPVVRASNDASREAQAQTEGGGQGQGQGEGERGVLKMPCFNLREGSVCIVGVTWKHQYSNPYLSGE